MEQVPDCLRNGGTTACGPNSKAKVDCSHCRKMNVTNCDETKDSGLTSRQRKCQFEGRAALKRPNVLSKLVHKGLHSSESKAFQSSHIVAIHWHFGEPFSWYSIVQLTNPGLLHSCAALLARCLDGDSAPIGFAPWRSVISTRLVTSFLCVKQCMEHGACRVCRVCPSKYELQHSKWT